jgi:hypothetical protein
MNRELNMTHKFIVFLSFCCVCLFAGHAQAMSVDGETCAGTLPAEVRALLESRFAQWKVVTIADLGLDERRLWRQKHDDLCPGIAGGRFDGSPNVSYAVTLLREHNKQLYQMLVLVHRTTKVYRIVILSPPQRVAVTSVVVKLPPGEFSTGDRSARIRTKFDVISYEAIEAGAIVYYWGHGQYKSLQTSE